MVCFVSGPGSSSDKDFLVAFPITESLAYGKRGVITTNLLVRDRSGSERIETLKSGSTSIGRGPENDILISDLSVSRSHARIDQSGESFLIVDVDSRHGVVINGKRISKPTIIKQGDRIELGRVCIEVLTSVELTDAAFRMDPDSTATLEYDRVPLVTPDTSWDEISGDPNLQIDPVIWAKFVSFLDAVSIARPRPLTEVLESIVAHCLKIFGQADRVCLILIEKEQPVPKVACQRNSSMGPVRVSQTVIRKVIETRKSFLSYNAQVEFVTKSVMEEGIFSLLCVPIIAEDITLGVLYLDTSAPGKLFNRNDLELLTIFANASAAHIEYHLLLEEAIRRRILEEEVRKAAEIQRRLLALCAPEVPGYGIHLGNIPCYAAGGDYVDTLWCGEKLFLALGDVSGKGIPAAMLTSTLQAAVHAQAMTSTDLSDIACRVNAFLHQRTSSEKFATLFLACLNADSGQLSYVNAGHCPPVILRRNRTAPERLGSTGLIIGAFPGSSYTVSETWLEPGDLLVVFTDGFFEQASPKGEEYGEDRLIEFLSQHRDSDLLSLAKELEADVMRFADDAEQQDDMTQLLVKRTLPE